MENEMTKNNTASQQTGLPVNKKSSGLLILSTALATLTLVGTVYGVYTYASNIRNKDVDTKNESKNTELSDKVDSMAKKLAGAETENAQLKKVIESLHVTPKNNNQTATAIVPTAEVSKNPKYVGDNPAFEFEYLRGLVHNTEKFNGNSFIDLSHEGTAGYGSTGASVWIVPFAEYTKSVDGAAKQSGDELMRSIVAYYSATQCDNVSPEEVKKITINNRTVFQGNKMITCNFPSAPTENGGNELVSVKQLLYLNVFQITPNYFVVVQTSTENKEIVDLVTATFKTL
jgi:hypothetical protein